MRWVKLRMMRQSHLICRLDPMKLLLKLIGCIFRGHLTFLLTIFIMFDLFSKWRE